MAVDRVVSSKDLTADQRRDVFEEMIGATPDRNPALWRELDQLIYTYRRERDERADNQVAELAEHFPGLKPAILLIWEHHIKDENKRLPHGVCDLEA